MRPPLPAPLSAVLANPNPSVIATVRPDGRPVSSAVRYLWDDGDVLTSLGARSARLRNLRAEPRASLTVFDGPDWYRQITVHGTVVSLDEDGDLGIIDRLSQHYEGRPYEARNPDRVPVTARIRVEDWDQFGFDLR
jgi:PPOX class probable F420-dependent enzyme